MMTRKSRLGIPTDDPITDAASGSGYGTTRGGGATCSAGRSAYGTAVRRSDDRHAK